MGENRFESDHDDLPQALRDARGDCPPPDRLLDWIAGKLDGEDARSVGTHVVLCSGCTEAVQRARDDDVDVDDLSWRRTDRRLAAREAPWRDTRPPGRPAWFAAAAAAVVVVAVLVTVWPDREQTSAPPPIDTVRDAQIELFEPLGTVPDSFAFQWRGIPAPVRYRIEVADGQETPERSGAIWTHSTPETRLRPDPSLAARLVPGRAYRWRIVVLDEEGQELARSAWQTFTLEG